MHDPAEVQRLEHLMKVAITNANDADVQQHNMQRELAKERNQYFEKIALGSGATIAAVVSFIGTHKDGLKPPWLLRAALMSLVLTMFSAMYRNFRYPYYLMNVWQAFKLSKWEARERAKRDFFLAAPAHSMQDGKLIDGREWAQDFDNRVQPMLKKKIESFEKGEVWGYRETKIVEAICVTCAVAGMSLLTALAYKNF